MANTLAIVDERETKLRRESWK